jgi:hypothetical protein
MPHKYELIVFWKRGRDVRRKRASAARLQAHSSTPAEAVGSALDAINLCLETAHATGRPVPDPTGRRLRFASAVGSGRTTSAGSGL